MVDRNRVSVELASIPQNVGVARLLAAILAAQADFTVAEVDEVKLAVSEAVTNAIVHGYQSDGNHRVRMELLLEGSGLEIIISDQGRGIENLDLAMQPAVSTDPERMGLGFSFMESHMDQLRVESELGRGTRVTMMKRAGTRDLARVKAN